MDDIKVKLIEPYDIDDVQLPELEQWDRVFGRPTSLNDLDPTADQELNDIDATFLSLGDLAYLDQITTTEITDNSISTPKLQAGAVEASKMSVGTLSSITADFGTMTSGEIIGALIKTSNSGERVELENDRIEVFDNNDERRFRSDDGELQFYDPSGNRVGMIYGNTSSFPGIFLESISGYSLQLLSDDDVIVDARNNLRIFADDIFANCNIEIDDGNFEITNDGFFNLARMSGSSASRTSGDQDGSMYYRTDDDVIRVKINGSWETVQTI